MDQNRETRTQIATSLVVRHATPEDADAAAKLMTALGYPASVEEMQRRIQDYTLSPLNAVFVAVSEGQIVGLLSFHCAPVFHANDFLGRITSLVVGDSHRRRGIGQQLVAAGEEFGRANGCERIEVTSGDRRPDAHAFYERLGYHVDCRRFIKRMEES